MRDVGGDEVDAGHVEPDDHRCLTSNLGVVGVDIVGAVDGRAAGAHVARLLELDVPARLGHRLLIQPLPAQRFQCLRVDRYPGEDLLVTDATTRISVGDFDEFGNGVRTIADDVSRHALGNRHHLIVDYQDAVVLACQESLEDHPSITAFVTCDWKCLHDFFVRGEIDHHTTTVVAIERLEHHWISHAPGDSDSIVW